MFSTPFLVNTVYRTDRMLRETLISLADPYPHPQGSICFSLLYLPFPCPLRACYLIEDPAAAPQKSSIRKPSFPVCFQQGFYDLFPAGQDKVDACLQALCLVCPVLACGKPVCHHDAVKAPLTAKNIGAQLPVIGAVYAVDLIIGGHDSPGRALPDGDLKALHIDLPDGPLVQIGGNVVAVLLLTVDGKVLDGHIIPRSFLDSADHGGRQFAGKQGILAVVFIVPSAEGIAHDVHGWCQPPGHPELCHFRADRSAHIFHQICIPGLCQGRHRKAGDILIQDLVLSGISQKEAGQDPEQKLIEGNGCIQGFDLSLFVYGGPALDAQSCRAVAE